LAGFDGPKEFFWFGSPKQRHGMIPPEIIAGVRSILQEDLAPAVPEEIVVVFLLRRFPVHGLAVLQETEQVNACNIGIGEHDIRIDCDDEAVLGKDRCEMVHEVVFDDESRCRFTKRLDVSSKDALNVRQHQDAHARSQSNSVPARHSDDGSAARSSAQDERHI
jgi:hypothetical protein